MATIKVPNLGKTEATKGMEVLKNGWYDLEVVNAPQVQDKSGGQTFNFMMRVLAGPEQDDGSDPAGRITFLNMFVMDPTHQEYDLPLRNNPSKTKGELSLENFKSVCEACNVDVTKSDNIDLESFAESQVRVYLKSRSYVGQDGEERVAQDFRTPWKAL